MGRPRPGANQTGAGSPITQHAAGGQTPSMTYPRQARRPVGGVR